MEIKLKYLLKKIEKLRKKLNRLIISKSRLTDKPIIDCSQKLDKLLNQYECYKNAIKNEAA